MQNLNCVLFVYIWPSRFQHATCNPKDVPGKNHRKRKTRFWILRWALKDGGMLLSIFHDMNMIQVVHKFSKCSMSNRSIVGEYIPAWSKCASGSLGPLAIGDLVEGCIEGLESKYTVPWRQDRWKAWFFLGIYGDLMGCYTETSGQTWNLSYCICSIFDQFFCLIISDYLFKSIAAPKKRRAMQNDRTSQNWWVAGEKVIQIGVQSLENGVGSNHQHSFTRRLKIVTAATFMILYVPLWFP